MPDYLFGKLPAKHDARTLRLQNYLSPLLPTPAPAHNVLAMVYANLRIADPTVLFPMDGNDVVGDCTIAAAAHASTVYHALIGKKTLMSRTQALKLYLRLTGGVDIGLNALTVLDYWRTHAVVGGKILAFASVDHRNHTHVKQAITLFGGVYVGFRVPVNCLAEFRARTPWTPGPPTDKGHAVFVVGYTADTLTVLTWGTTQTATWAWWDECIDEAYAILPPEAKEPGFAPGVDVTQLLADLNAVTN